MVAERPRDMVPILAALIDDLGRDLRPGRIVLTLPDTPVPSRLDPDAFAVLARNMVENALLHGAPDTAVAVALTPAGTLQVINDSAPLPAETLARLTKRFERNGSRAAGSGLGLTIARSIAVTIERDLRLVSPLPGDFNRTNTAIAALALLLLGHTDDEISTAMTASVMRTPAIT